MTPEKPLLTSDLDSSKTRQPSNSFSISSTQPSDTSIVVEPSYEADELRVSLIQNPKSDVDLKHKTVPTILHRTVPTVSNRGGDFIRGVNAASTHQRLMQGRLDSSTAQADLSYVYIKPNEREERAEAPAVEEEFTLHTVLQPTNSISPTTNSQVSSFMPSKNVVEVFHNHPQRPETNVVLASSNSDSNVLLPLSFSDIVNNSLDSSLRFPTDIFDVSQRTNQKIKVAHKSREVANGNAKNVSSRYVYGSVIILCIVGYLLFRLMFGGTKIGKLVQEDFNGVLFQKPKNATLVLEKSNQAKRFYTSNGKTIDFADGGGIKDIKKDKQSPVYGINYAVTDYQDVVLSDLSDKAVLKDELVAKFKKEDSTEDNCVRGLNSQSSFNENSDYAVEMTFVNTCDENKNGVAEVEKGRIIIAKDSRKFILVSFVTSQPIADTNQKSIDTILSSIDAAH
jgi:hypothetical protein